MKKEKNTIIVAIGAIAVLEIAALIKGVNGTFFIISMVAISGLGGYQLKDIVHKLNGTKK